MITSIHPRANRIIVVAIQIKLEPLPTSKIPVAVVTRSGKLPVAYLGAEPGGEGDVAVVEEGRGLGVDPEGGLTGGCLYYGDVAGDGAGVADVVGHLGGDDVFAVAAVG